LGSEIEIPAEELPRIEPVEPGEVMATFELAEGFDLALVAHEPDVMDPIAMAFDEQGRAYVIEMRGYSERRDDALCRIRLLTDTNGDGRFDHSTVFKDGLKWPTAILCYDGGVFVGATPDIHFYRDNSGDGVSDEERHLFTGFGEGAPRLNMQALFNSFRWGPDNRVWGATAGNGGIVAKPDDPAFEPVPVRGADFSFDPEELDFRPENGTVQYGMSFDSQGRRYVCGNSRHLVWVAYERHHFEPNPFYAMPRALVDIPDDGAAGPVFRISPDEPWRVVRTRLRVSGAVPGAVEGGGRVSGYFTSATGVHIYWGALFGPDFHDNVFVGDVGSNLVHRKVLHHREGSTELVGSRPDPEERTEFLRSTDIWFRPSSFANGPDGCLYICDMYREVIEHPWSLPEPIKKHLDLNSGYDRGRIYRVAPKGFRPGPFEDLSLRSDEELEALLEAETPSDWHETTARRLLYERGKPRVKLPASPFPAVLSAESVPREARDPWLRAAYLNSLRTVEALDEALGLLGPGEEELAVELAGMVGRSGDEALAVRVVETIADSEVDAHAADRLAALKQGAASHRGLAALVSQPERWSASMEKGAALLRDGSAPQGARASAIRLLSLIGGSENQALLRSAFEEIAAEDPLFPELARAVTDLSLLVARFGELPDAARAEAANRLAGDAAQSLALLGRLAGGEVELAQVPASLLEGWRQHESAEVKALAAETLPPVVSRSDVIAEYQPALTLAGDAERGKAAFAKACLACHLSHEGEGIPLGPPVASFASAGKDSLLENILDPGREVAPQYQAFVFELNDGSLLTGIILSEDQEEVTVRMPGGIDRTFPRREVASMKGVGQSLMPDGLEATLSVEEMADLLAYILQE